MRERLEHDEERIAEGLVELDGLLQLVAQQSVDVRVRAAAFQAALVEDLAEVRGTWLRL